MHNTVVCVYLYKNIYTYQHELIQAHNYIPLVDSSCNVTTEWQVYLVQAYTHILALHKALSGEENSFPPLLVPG